MHKARFTLVYGLIALLAIGGAAAALLLPESPISLHKPKTCHHTATQQGMRITIRAHGLTCKQLADKRLNPVPTGLYVTNDTVRIEYTATLNRDHGTIQATYQAKGQFASKFQGAFLGFLST